MIRQFFCKLFICYEINAEIDDCGGGQFLHVLVLILIRIGVITELIKISSIDI